MDGPTDCHTEWRKSEKDISYDIAYMWNLLKWYKWTYLENRVTDVKNKLMVKRGKGGMDKLGDWDWHIHTIIYKTDN